MGAEVFHALKKVLHDRGLSTAVGDEGGFAPALAGTEDALDSIMSRHQGCRLRTGQRCDDRYGLCFFRILSRTVSMTTPSLKVKKVKNVLPTNKLTYLEDLINKYPIDSIEDGMSENDWEGWKKLTERIGNRCQLVGDDLFVTNVEFLAKGIAHRLRQLYPDQSQSNRFAHVKHWMLSKWLTATDIPLLLLTVPAKPKTPPLQTLP